MKKGALKGIVCLVVIVVIWMAVSFRSKPLSEEGEISLENFVVCRVQMMEIKNDTGYVSGAEIREKERMQKALDALGEIEVRKMMPWEKLLFRQAGTGNVLYNDDLVRQRNGRTV